MCFKRLFLDDIGFIWRKGIICGFDRIEGVLVHTYESSRTCLWVKIEDSESIQPLGTFSDDRNE